MRRGARSLRRRYARAHADVHGWETAVIDALDAMGVDLMGGDAELRRLWKKGLTPNEAAREIARDS